jgi:hypothetical protein
MKFWVSHPIQKRFICIDSRWVFLISKIVRCGGKSLEHALGLQGVLPTPTNQQITMPNLTDAQEKDYTRQITGILNEYKD